MKDRPASVEERERAAMRRRQRVLVACEYSGRVRAAFRALGHDAWSCDLLPSEDGCVVCLDLQPGGRASNE